MDKDFDMRLIAVSLSEGFGGAEIALLRMLSELHNQFEDFRVICVAAPERMIQAASAVPGVEVRPASPRYQDILTTRRTIAKAARALGADAVLANNNRSIYLCRAMALGLPLAAYQHCDLSVPSVARWRIIARRALASHIYGGYVQVACTSRRIIDDLSKLGLEQRCVYMPNAVPIVSESPDRQGLRRLIGASPTERIIVQVGRLEPGKNPALTVAALADLPEVRGVFIGDGPQLAELVQLAAHLGIKDRCTWLGYRNDARSLIAGADALVLPSASETTPLCILEAMDAGVPVVASSVGGIPEQIVDGKSGLLMPALDAVSLAGRIKILFEHPGLAERIAAAGLARVRECFAMRACAQRFASMLQNVAGHT